MSRYAQADAGEALRAVLNNWSNDPGFKTPPDAGESTLHAYGLGSWLVVWLLNRAPELLELSPRELLRGLQPPMCKACYHRKVMRITEADPRRRLPKRLVWRCYHHVSDRGPFSSSALREEEIELKPMPKAQLSLVDMLEATRRGATLDYQRPMPGAAFAPLIVEPAR